MRFSKNKKGLPPENTGSILAATICNTAAMGKMFLMIPALYHFQYRSRIKTDQTFFILFFIFFETFPETGTPLRIPEILCRSQSNQTVSCGQS